jgi:hypothetical protein
MPTFQERVSSAITGFKQNLGVLTDLMRATPAKPDLPKKEVDKLLETSLRAGAAADAIAFSFGLIERTGLDIVDMQVRLQGETARLASALDALGETVNKRPSVPATFGQPLIALDEAAQLVAAAVFPSAVEGLRDVNVKLWDFQKIQWKRYTDILNSVVQGRKITAAQQVKIQEIADAVFQAFDAVNSLLNELAEGRVSDAEPLRERMASARKDLKRVLQDARRRMTDTFKMFAPVINASDKIADDVAEELDELIIPVYPSHDRLGELSGLVDRALYDSLSGVQAFALLNISARMQATKVAGQTLLSPANGIRVMQVFPDRIYFEAAKSMITAIGNDPQFQSAPAALHRFNEGSFKQQTFKKGNLQVSFASRPGDRVVVDADIDLYRLSVPHLFGEVLVNHLTGKTTDQFSVRGILDDQSVVPIGGFQLLTA